jgi:hypothetical protein
VKRRVPTQLLVAWAVALAAVPFVRAQMVPTTMPALAPATQVAQDRLKPAADAAWALLETMRDYVHASQIVDNPRERAGALAAAKHRLMGLVTLRPGGDSETLSTYVQMWPAVVARYVDGFDRNKMTLMQADRHIVVMALAANPHDQQVYDQILQQIDKDLEEEGLRGEALATRRQVRLIRELAQQGIGYPVSGVVQIILQNVNGQWKASELDLRPPRVPSVTSQPAAVVGGAPAGSGTPSSQ